MRCERIALPTEPYPHRVIFSQRVQYITLFGVWQEFFALFFKKIPEIIVIILTIFVNSFTFYKKNAKIFP